MKTILFAIAAALPLMAQDDAPQPTQCPNQPTPCSAPAAPEACKPAPAPCCPKPVCGAPKPEGKPGCRGPKHGDREARRAAFMEKFDTNKDGKIDEQEKEAIKAAFAARKAEFEKKILEKYDTNKDGQLDEQEKAAAKADFMKHHAGRPHRHHGPRKPCCCGCKCSAPAAAPAPEAPEAPAPAPAE